jgi:hypothetical protein
VLHKQSIHFIKGYKYESRAHFCHVHKRPLDCFVQPLPAREIVAVLSYKEEITLLRERFMHIPLVVLILVGLMLKAMPLIKVLSDLVGGMNITSIRMYALGLEPCLTIR